MRPARGPGPLWKDPKRIAEEVLARSGAPRLAGRSGIDIERILRYYRSIDVMYISDLSPGGTRIDALFVPEFSIVMVEANSLEGRQRFSLAHELGHAELEHDYGPADSLFDAQPVSFLCEHDDMRSCPVDDRRIGMRRRAEIRANQFAATLLMPVSLVREVWRETGNVRTCAEELGVSKRALEIRLSELRLVSISSAPRLATTP